MTVLWPQWSSDGRYIVYQRQSGPSGASVWAVPTGGDKTAFPVVQPQAPQARVVQFRLSPDSKWLAYSSTDSGREEVYVTQFPSGNGRWQVSQNGGTFPVWGADGKELYFLDYLGTETHVDAIEVNAKGDQFETRNLRNLFPIHAVPAAVMPFDVSPTVGAS